MRQCYQGRSPYVGYSRIRLRSLVSRLAGKCSDGQEGKWQMEDVCGLHRSKQGIP